MPRSAPVRCSASAHACRNRVIGWRIRAVPHTAGGRWQPGGVTSSDWARPVVHWELEARDPERQRAFYRALCHWDVGEGPIMMIPAGLGGPGTGPRWPHPGWRQPWRPAVRPGQGARRVAGRWRSSSGVRWCSDRSMCPAVRRWRRSSTPRATRSCSSSSRRAGRRCSRRRQSRSCTDAPRPWPGRRGTSALGPADRRPNRSAQASASSARAHRSMTTHSPARSPTPRAVVRRRRPGCW